MTAGSGARPSARSRRRAGLALLTLLFLDVILFAVSDGVCAQPPSLSRGINITGWFRFPSSRRPADLAAYLGDAALADLRAAGFDFVRLAVDPAMAAAPADRVILIKAIRRIERQGLAVIVAAHPQGLRLEDEPSDRERLREFWLGLAPALRPLDPTRTIPEILNEPVFHAKADEWAGLQHSILQDIRHVLPGNLVVLTGNEWGSIKGLLALAPEPDPRVLYSFHFYDPAELTSLAAYRPGLDRAALRRLPYPVDAAADCEAAAITPDAPTADLIRYYCALRWDAGRIEGELEQAVGWARGHHARLLAGEFGASVELNAQARLAWLGAVRTGLARRDIAWALWGYDDVMGLNVKRPPGQRPSLDRDVLKALGLVSLAPSPAVRPASYLELP